MALTAFRCALCLACLTALALLFTNLLVGLVLGVPHERLLDSVMSSSLLHSDDLLGGLLGDLLGSVLGNLLGSVLHNVFAGMAHSPCMPHPRSMTILVPSCVRRLLVVRMTPCTSEVDLHIILEFPLNRVLTHQC